MGKWTEVWKEVVQGQMQANGNLRKALWTAGTCWAKGPDTVLYNLMTWTDFFWKAEYRNHSLQQCLAMYRIVLWQDSLTILHSQLHLTCLLPHVSVTTSDHDSGVAMWTLTLPHLKTPHNLGSSWHLWSLEAFGIVIPSKSERKGAGNI